MWRDTREPGRTSKTNARDWEGPHEPQTHFWDPRAGCGGFRRALSSHALAPYCHNLHEFRPPGRSRQVDRSSWVSTRSSLICPYSQYNACHGENNILKDGIGTEIQRSRKDSRYIICLTPGSTSWTWVEQRADTSNDHRPNTGQARHLLHPVCSCTYSCTRRVRNPIIPRRIHPNVHMPWIAPLAMHYLFYRGAPIFTRRYWVLGLHSSKFTSSRQLVSSVALDKLQERRYPRVVLVQLGKRWVPRSNLRPLDTEV